MKQGALSKGIVMRGFTLIELLVAVAVFALLVVLIFHVVTETARSTGVGNRRLEATQSARSSLDTLAEDLLSVVSNHGLTIVVGNNGTGDTTLAFLCASRPDNAYTGKPRMGGVLYHIRNRSEGSDRQVPVLYRGFQSVPWANNLHDALAVVYNASLSADNAVFDDTLGPLIFRMEVVYLKHDGIVTPFPPLRPGAFDSDPALNPSGTPLNLDEVKAIIVTVAALDRKTQGLLLSSDNEGMTKLAAALPAVTQDQMTPLALWQTESLEEFPSPVRQNIRFFQRTLYLR